MPLLVDQWVAYALVQNQGFHMSHRWPSETHRVISCGSRKMACDIPILPENLHCGERATARSPHFFLSESKIDQQKSFKQVSYTFLIRKIIRVSKKI